MRERYAKFMETEDQNQQMTKTTFYINELKKKPGTTYIISVDLGI